MIVAPLNEKHLLLRVELSGKNLALMRSFPGFSKFEGRALRVRINGVNLSYICKNWMDAEWIGGSNDLKVEHLRRMDENDLALEAKNTGAIIPDDDYAYKREPMKHQREAFLLGREREAFGYFMEQGTGKTKVTLDEAGWLFQKGKIDMLVVVAWPNGVHRMWVDDEIGKDLAVPNTAAYWSPKKTKKQKAIYEEVFDAPKDHLKVFTFNVEAFTSEAAKEMILRCVENYRCMVCIDQSAAIKNPSALRTEFLINEVSKHAKVRRILDGDPVAEGAEELYSQFRFLDPWIIGHDTFTAFKAEYCILNQWRGVAGYRNFDQLKALIDPHCFRVLSSDCLDLPPLSYRRWEFDLSKDERRIFKELKSKSLTFFDGELSDEEKDELPEFNCIEEGMALVKNMRLQQISSGWWPEKDNFKPIEPKKGKAHRNSRLLALLLLLQQNKGKALIFSRFRADLDMLQEVLGDEAVSYHGGISGDDRAKAKIRFQEDPSCQYFIGQPRNAGIGHTLTAASHVVFYSNDPSLRLRKESEKRAHRMGLKHHLTVWDLSARGSHDRNIINALRKKKRISDEILEDPESFFLEYE